MMLQNAAVTLVFWEELPDLHCRVNSKIQDDNKNVKRSKCIVKSKIHQSSKKSIEIKPG